MCVFVVVFLVNRLLATLPVENLTFSKLKRQTFAHSYHKICTQIPQILIGRHYPHGVMTLTLSSHLGGMIVLVSF